jgi:pyruvate/2-oxoglutarate dehydrogenase complex dihydrolipoamide dehydrogenase (E3) component
MKARPSYDYDVAIIGGGSAGYAAARTAAAEGLKTVVLEDATKLGGLCILRGCMPSKALLYAADVLHLARNAKTWGLKIPKSGFDFKAVMARKNAMIADFANYRHEQLHSDKFKLLRSRAKFIDSHTLTLTHPRDPSPKTLTAKHFIICTGSVSAPSSIPHLQEIGFLNSDDALDLKRLPKSLIVLGGGPIAVELAQFFARFDVKVTVIQRSANLLRDFDTDAAMALESALRRDGITLCSNTRLIGAFREKRRKGIIFESQGQTKRVTAQEILFALGRCPATSHLGLEKTRIHTEEARIVVNAEMQTTASHIYAAGDCASPYQIVHIGVEQGEIAAHNIAHPVKKRSIDYRLLTSVVFTDPQVASVGLTEKQAVARNVPFLVASYPFHDHGKSMIMDVKDGFVKLLANPSTGEILGGTCVGPMGGELIHEIIAAMQKRMTVAELASMPHYHPTLAEIWTYPAAHLADRIKAKVIG